MTDSKTVVEDLAAWLTQIWDEEERLAKRAGDALTTPEIDNYGHLTVPSAWMLARIAADRKILAMHTGFHECPSEDDNCGWCTDDRCATVRLMASPYADRPGFRPEWSVERQGVEW